MTVSIKLKRWFSVAAFAGWMVWYSIPVTRWRDNYLDWFCSQMAKRATVVEVHAD